MTCIIKRQYLKLLGENPEALSNAEKQVVREYGPVDMNDPDNRVLFVQTVSGLINHLLKIAK